MKAIKNFAIAIILIMVAINSSQAVAPAGTEVTASVALQGGSKSALKWNAPLTAPYKVHVFVPSTGNKTNALYRVYPKGKLATTTNCVSTDLTYPCYEVSVDQTQHKGAWTQLTLNGDVATQWDFLQGKGYVTAVASNLSTTQMLNLSALVRFENMGIIIGRTYQGGIIFYLDSTGQHGLIAAPTDQKDMLGNVGIHWLNAPNGSSFIIPTSNAIGTGQANTTAIVTNQSAGNYAAKICDDLVLSGYSDWYLPSKDELNLMYTNIGQGATGALQNIGGFANFRYWSSSEYVYLPDFHDHVGSQNFFDGDNIGGYWPTSNFYVRAIRSF
jgi:hypothetical protein